MDTDPPPQRDAAVKSDADRLGAREAGVPSPDIKATPTPDAAQARDAIAAPADTSVGPPDSSPDVAPASPDVAPPPELPPQLYEGPFVLTVGDGGNCVEIARHSLASGAYAQTAKCDASAWQVFKLEQMSAGVYQLMSSTSGMCLEVEGGAAADGAKIRQVACKVSASEQGFKIVATSGGYTQLITKAGKCVEDRNAGVLNGAVLYQSPCNTTTGQNWMLNRNLPAIVKLRLKHDGKCMETSAEGKAATPFTQAPCDARPAQQFRTSSLGGSKFTLVSQSSKNCVDVPSSSLMEGVNVWEWPCNGTSAQWFRIEGVGAGYNRIVNVNSGLCLGVAGGAGADHMPIEQATCRDGDNQRWSVTAP